ETPAEYMWNNAAVADVIATTRATILPRVGLKRTSPCWSFVIGRPGGRVPVARRWRRFRPTRGGSGACNEITVSGGLQGWRSRADPRAGYRHPWPRYPDHVSWETGSTWTRPPSKIDLPRPP